ncbi:hypothetical protein A4R44_09370 [Amycolatopsis sp. M39]|nr:hypothetical protein A4R44_09370 [Amycolatopsis sp. M39]
MAACSVASFSAWLCTFSNARATSPTSSCTWTGTGSTSTLCARPSWMLRTASGRSFSATSSADRRRIFSERSSWRAMTNTTAAAAASAANSSTASRPALLPASSTSWDDAAVRSVLIRPETSVSCEVTAFEAVFHSCAEVRLSASSVEMPCPPSTVPSIRLRS